MAILILMIIRPRLTFKEFDCPLNLTITLWLISITHKRGVKFRNKELNYIGYFIHCDLNTKSLLKRNRNQLSKTRVIFGFMVIQKISILQLYLMPFDDRSVTTEIAN
jgi:hypothetical protein